ncbi:MAG: beta-galactosidase, partial [Thermoleophilaceae bacterium]
MSPDRLAHLRTRLASPIAFGGDYNPEQWPETTWREDVALMQEAGVNLVTVGVFSWARLEPRPGEMDFDWLDRVLELLHAGGIAVDLATATASPPAWLVRAHPEVLPVTEDGVRLEHGSRQHYCPSSAAYREAAAHLVEALAARYGEHPALAMWHVGNEYGVHTSACYCDSSAAHFRAWLVERYGDVDSLNRVWGTDFWSQRYESFEEVNPPRRAPSFRNPGQLLDWRRFCSDAMLECYRAERDILHRATPDVPVTTNFYGLRDELDLWAWAAEEDVVSNDAYPEPADPAAAAVEA